MPVFHTGLVVVNYYPFWKDAVQFAMEDGRETLRLKRVGMGHQHCSTPHLFLYNFLKYLVSFTWVVSIYHSTMRRDKQDHTHVLFNLFFCLIFVKNERNWIKKFSNNDKRTTWLFVVWVKSSHAKLHLLIVSPTVSHCLFMFVVKI